MTAKHGMTGWEGRPDAEVIRALAGQDLTALRELHRRYARLLYALAQHKGHPHSEQWVQDVFMHIMRHAESFARSPLQARVWVIAMAHNVGA